MVQYQMPTFGPSDPNAAMCFEYLSMAYDFSDACGVNTTCLCSNVNFMQTSIGCIAEISQLKDTKTNLITSLNSIVQFCPSTSFEQLERYLNTVPLLSAYSGTKNLSEIGHWKADLAFKPSAFDINHAYDGYYSIKECRYSSQKFGAALLAYWGGILLLHAVFHVWKQILPRSYMKLANSKVCRLWRKHLTLSTCTALWPSNLLGLEVIGFFIISMIFSFAGFPLFRNNYVFKFKQSIGYGLFCGIRSGYFALYLAPLMILFAGRNNFLQGISGLSQDRYVYYHRWIARVVVLLVLIHAIAYTVWFAAEQNYSMAWKRTPWKWGIVSLAFGCFMVVQAARFLRRRAYETFLLSHIVAAVFFIVGGYYHIYKMDEHKGLGFFYAMVAVWGFDRVMRLVRICLSKCGQKATLKTESGMLMVTAPFPKWWNLRNNPGTYTFIHFLNTRHFHQSHPFTMYMNPDNLDELKLVCRVKNGVTRTMDEMVAETDGELETRICLDGPYGHSLNLQVYDELVFLAGGVGITAVFSYAQHLLLTDTKNDQRIRIFWAVRDTSVEFWYEAELEFLRSHFTVEMNLYVGDGRTEKQEPLDVYSEIKNVFETINGSTAILCCGPDGMAKDARASVVENLCLTSYYVDYFEESFSW